MLCYVQNLLRSYMLDRSTNALSKVAKDSEKTLSISAA